MHPSSDKISTHHSHDRGKIFAWMALISSTGYSSFLTMLPIVLSEKLGNEIYVGYYFSIIAIVSLLVSLGSTMLLRYISKVLLAKIILTSLCIIFIALTFATNIYNFALIDIARVTCITLFFIILAIFVRDFAAENEVALAEGRFYLFTNIGWVIGPLAGGFMAKTYGSESAFIFSAFCYLILVIIFFHQHLRVKNPHLHDKKEITKPNISFWKNLRDFARQKELRNAFLISYGMYCWWSISAIYMALAITEMGFSQQVVGLVFSLSVIPLILLEFHTTDAARKYGVRNLLVIGYAILAIMLLLFTQTSGNTLIKLMILVNIGSAFIEPNKEVFFFKQVNQEDEERFYGIYNASYPIAYITAPAAGALLLSSFGMNGIWFGAAFVFILMTFVALSINKKY
mgnify:CR=1 FL=1